MVPLRQACLVLGGLLALFSLCVSLWSSVALLSFCMGLFVICVYGLPLLLESDQLWKILCHFLVNHCFVFIFSIALSGTFIMSNWTYSLSLPAFNFSVSLHHPSL